MLVDRPGCMQWLERFDLSQGKTAGPLASQCRPTWLGETIDGTWDKRPLLAPAPGATARQANGRGSGLSGSQERLPAELPASG